MSYASFLTLPWIPAVAIWACVFACGCCYGQAEGHPGATLGTMKADRILILGNSITLHSPWQPYGWNHHCGMAASTPEKDYVHLLATGIDARTGGHLQINPTDPAKLGLDGAIITGDANVLNIADIFERRYTTYANSQLQQQLDWKADIVVLQFGENMVMEDFHPDAFESALQMLMNGLKASSNPHIFVTSQILRPGGAIDEIKRQVCAEDPSHRVFVDLSAFGQDPTNFARSESYYTGVIVGHPGNKGMALIADTLLKAMVAHANGKSVPPTPAAPATQ